MSQTTGLFLTIEGTEGVGKSTAVKFIQDVLQKAGQPTVFTREPGGTPIAESLRQILLMPNKAEVIVPDVELLLMFASRAQHIAHLIRPALERGDWVLSDRFVDASYAYQGGGRQLDLAKIETLDRWVVQDLKPTLTFLLDAPVEVGMKRAKHRGPQDRIEQEKKDFFERVRAMYLQRARGEPERFRIIDATKPLAEVHRQIKSILENLLQEKSRV